MSRQMACTKSTLLYPVYDDDLPKTISQDLYRCHRKHLPSGIRGHQQAHEAKIPNITRAVVAAPHSE